MSQLLITLFGLFTYCFCSLLPPHAFANNSEETSSISEAPTYDKTSFKQLLTAKLAERSQPELALDYYLSLADRLHSAIFAERATYFALQLANNQALHKATDIWHQQQPDNAKALFFKSVSLAYRQDISGALMAMQAAENKGHTTDFTWIVQLLPTDDASTQQALSHFNQDNLLGSTNYDALIACALLLSRSGNTAIIDKLIGRAITLGHSNPTTFRLAAFIYEQLHQSDKALALYQQGALQHPGSISLRLQWAELLTQTNVVEAILQFEMLNLQWPHTPLITKRLMSLYLENGQLNVAKKQAFELAEHAPENAAAIEGLVRISLAEGRPLDAAAWLEQLPETHLVDPLYLSTIDDLINHQEIALANQLIRKRQDRAILAHYQLALEQLAVEALLAEDKPQKALKKVANLIQEYPDHDYFKLKSALIAASSLDPAALAAHLNKLFSKEDTSVELFQQLGQELALHNQSISSLKPMLSTLLTLSANNPILLDSFGWLLYRMGELEEAAQWVARAWEASRNRTFAVHLSQIYAALGDKQQALKLLDQAQELSDDQHLSQLPSKQTAPSYLP